MCNTVTNAFVTLPQRNATPDPTRPDPLVTEVCGVSGSTSIDLTVGLDSPPDAWMETDDLNLLDDGKAHASCSSCSRGKPPRAFEAFTAVCGKRALARHDMGLNPPRPNACQACESTDQCPKCGAWF